MIRFRLGKPATPSLLRAGIQLTPRMEPYSTPVGQLTPMAVEEETSIMSARSARVSMHVALVALIALTAGCSTQHFTSPHPANVVAKRIATGWEQCAASGKLPVLLERQDKCYFVGVAMPSLWLGLPSGTRHSNYPVWAEVVDTDSGSVTTYHKAFQIFSSKLDSAVRKSQE
jgi:hypothetical protein